MVRLGPPGPDRTKKLYTYASWLFFSFSSNQHRVQKRCILRVAREYSAESGSLRASICCSSVSSSQLFIVAEPQRGQVLSVENIMVCKNPVAIAAGSDMNGSFVIISAYHNYVPILSNMFTVKAGYSSDIEVRTSIDKVRDFFADVTNFAEMMPGVEQIHTDARGIAHWKVQASVPVVGHILQKFAVEMAENSEDRIEWSPLRTEAENFLRYSADFYEKAKGVTMIRFSQAVELRRKKASELHSLAWLAGESLISSEMTKSITEMIKVFIGRAKEKLEK